MKYFISVLAISFFITGCGKSPKKTSMKVSNKLQFDSSAMKTSPVNNPDQKFILKYDFQKGKTYHYRLTTIAHDNKTIHADTTMLQNVEQQITYLIDFNLTGVDKNNIMELSCNISAIKLNASANGKHFRYVSNTPLDSIDKIRYADYESLINNPFALRVSPKGEIREIFHVDKIVSKFLSIRGIADSATSDQKDAIRYQMINGALKPLLRQIFRQMPDGFVAKDSAWTNAQPPSRILIYKLQSINDYKVQNLVQWHNDKIAVLEAGLITKITGNDTYNRRGVSYKFEKPKTSANGIVYFNISKGLIQKSKTHSTVKTAFSMKMSIPNGKRSGNQKEIMTNTNIVELL